jgi:hypothetical protein
MAPFFVSLTLVSRPHPVHTVYALGRTPTWERQPARGVSGNHTRVGTCQTRTCQ